MSIDSQVAVILEKITAVVEQNGPAAIQTAQEVVQINAINSLVSSAGWSLILAVLVWMTLWCRNKWKNHDLHEDDVGYIIGTVLGAIASLIVFLVVISPIFDAWTWVAIFNPKLALAHEIMEKIL